NRKVRSMPAAQCGESNWQLRQGFNRSQMPRRRPSEGFLPSDVRIESAAAVQNESFSWVRTSNRHQLSLIHPQLKSVSPTSVPLITRSDSSQQKFKTENR